jgi:hypothetical protein
MRAGAVDNLVENHQYGGFRLFNILHSWFNMVNLNQVTFGCSPSMRKTSVSQQAAFGQKQTLSTI